jgi:hypothetical protein
MIRWLLAMFLALPPVLAFAAEPPFACDMRALTKSERDQHAGLSRQLLASARVKRELSNGYALRLPADLWLPAAQWVALERRCCPFFAFELESASRGGPLWLRITGPAGAKTFMHEELGL